MTDYWFEDRLKELFRLYTGGALSPRWKNDKPNVSNRPRSNDLSQSEEGMKIKMAIKGKEKDPQILFSPTLPTEGELVRKGKHSYVVMEVYRPLGDDPMPIIHVRPSQYPCKGVVHKDVCVCGVNIPLVATDRGNLCGACTALMITRLSRENDDMFEELKELKKRLSYWESLDKVNKADQVVSVTPGVVTHSHSKENGILSQTTIDHLHELFKESSWGKMKDIDWRARLIQQVDEAGAAEMDLHEMVEDSGGQPAFYHVVHRAIGHITSALMALLEGLELPEVIEEKAGQPCPFCKKGTARWDDMTLSCDRCHAVFYNRSPSGEKKEPKEVGDNWWVPHGIDAGEGGCHGRKAGDGKCENPYCGYQGGKL